MKTKAELLLSTSQTVYSVDDLAVLWQISERSKLWENIKYYVRTDRLYPIQRGVYALSEKYSPLEAAVKLVSPAYISYTTALAFHGAYYQYSSEIHAMASISKTLILPNGQEFVYHQLKNDILLNQDGVEKVDGYWIASLERAICDTSYLIPSFPFEYLDKVNPTVLIQMAGIYDNRSLVRRIQKIVTREFEEGVE